MEIVAYGLTEVVPDQLDLSIADVALMLRDHGVTAVFLKHLIPAWVQALHDVGLSVYASKGVFIDQDDLWARLPDSRPLTADGSPAPLEEWYRPLLPTHSGVRELRLREIDALNRAVPIDGLWLDFIRWPARWEKSQPALYHSSFDVITLAQFQQESGIVWPVELESPTSIAAWILDNVARAWFDWRCDVIVGFVDEARALVKAQRPQARLGCFTVPWTGEGFDALPIEQAHLRIVGQDPVMLGTRVDVLSPMVYHRLCGREPSWPQQVTTGVQRQVECDVWPTVEAIDDDHGYSTEIFIDVCRSAADAGRGGLIVFNLAGLLADQTKLMTLKTLR